MATILVLDPARKRVRTLLCGGSGEVIQLFPSPPDGNLAVAEEVVPVLVEDVAPQLILPAEAPLSAKELFLDDYFSPQVGLLDWLLGFIPGTKASLQKILRRNRK